MESLKVGPYKKGPKYVITTPYDILILIAMIHNEDSRLAHSRIQKICQRGYKFDVFFLFFLVDEGREGPNTTISQPSSVCQRNAI